MRNAVILDFNGVIISDEDYHRQSWKIFIKKLGFKLSEIQYEEKVFGHTEKEVFEYLYKKELSKNEVEKLSNQRNKIVYKLEGKFIPVPGVLEFIKNVKNSNLLLGLATNSRKAYMEKVLKDFGVLKIFDSIVTAEDVQNGKPHPEIYLKCANSLVISPKNCVVFEDSIAGIQSAKNAGMRVIALTTTLPKHKIPKVEKYVEDFTEVKLKNLFN